MSRTEFASRLTVFVHRWLRGLIPGLRAVRVAADGTVSAQDPIGWRDVGHVSDFIPLARALGAIPSR